MFGVGIVRDHDEEMAFNDDDDVEDEDEELDFSYDDEHDDVDDDDDDVDDDEDDDDDDEDENVMPTPVHLVTEMNKIKTNDPNFTTLEVGVTYKGLGEAYMYIPPANPTFPGDDWAGLGQAIGRSKYLTELSFHIDSWRHFFNIRPNSGALLEFLPGFISNRSIQKLSIGCWDFNREEILDNLKLFFKHNQVLESLEVISGRDQDGDEDSDDNYKIKYDGPMRHYPIYSALLLFHSLKEFKLDNDPDTSFYADDVIEALNGHTCLRKLSLSGVIIEMKGFTELAIMRQNPMSNLTTLHLHNCDIDSEGMIFFAGCLSSYSTLKELTISSARGKYGWQPILFSALQSSNIKLTGLDFSGTWINNDDARSLSKTLLCHNATIKNLSLGALVGNLVTVTAGWSDFFESLRSTNSALETLNLCDNTITNGTLITLERALINNSRLRELCLQGNSSVTPEGWKTLSRVLRNPNSSLEVLDLRNNRMNDKVVVSFAEALANNHRLRELNLDLYYKRISNLTSDGLAAFYRVLCDNTSITNTYYSNHTLQRIFGDIRELPFDIDLYSLLRMNNESNKFEVARLKIIMEHFAATKSTCSSSSPQWRYATLGRVSNKRSLLINVPAVRII